jgi:hypothetical protein
MLSSHASSTTGRGIAVSGLWDQSPLPTGKGVSGNGLVLIGVLGGRLLVGSLVKLMDVSLGRLL